MRGDSDTGFMSDFVQITRRAQVPEEDFYPVINRMYEQIWQNLLPQQIPTDGLSNTVKNNVITPPDAPKPDCLTCGACCQSLLCVGVRPSDTVDPELCWDITVKIDAGEMVVDRYLRRNGETLACAALAGQIGEQVECTIYETRPVTCHHFDAGSDRCHAIRRAFGIEPFLTLDEMSAAMEGLGERADADSSDVIRNAQIRPDVEKGEYVITALMKDGTLKEIHRYDPSSETWMQFEFEGLKLAEAAVMIGSRNADRSGLQQ
jgi:Fe-S-cluster containining protein